MPAFWRPWGSLACLDAPRALVRGFRLVSVFSIYTLTRRSFPCACFPKNVFERTCGERVGGSYVGALG